LICAAETEQGCEESEAVSTERGCSGSALGGWPRKYAQETWFALVCAAETKQSEAPSPEGDCPGSELDGWPFAEERTALLAVGSVSGWLIDAGLT
jgi:hypothetical protein